MTVILHREYEHQTDEGIRWIEMRCVGEHESRDAIREQPEPCGCDFAVYEASGKVNALGLPESYKFVEFVRAEDNTNAPGPNVKLRKLDAKAKLKHAAEVNAELERWKEEQAGRFDSAEKKVSIT